MKIKIFGLLHLAENEKSMMNDPAKGFQEQVSVYVNNAIVLSKSLKAHSVSFGLLTNNKLLIEEHVSKLGEGYSLEIIEIPFTTKVPSGIRFFSAHYKIDVFRYIASLKGSYYAFCDLDMVCINDFPPCLSNIIEARVPLCYDISDQVIPAYGHDVIIKDLSKIGKMKSEGRWYGGEFISGTPLFFSKLVVEIDNVYQNYVSNIASLHHVGDEALSSVALEKLKRQGVYIADAGNIFVVGRYWSVRVLHTQNPFSYFKNCFLLHLPADKKFISNFANLKSGNVVNFLSVYEKNVNAFSSKLKKLARLIVRFIISVTGKALRRTAKDIS